MTVREYAETFSNMLHCTECYRCKSDDVLCHNFTRPEVNIEPWKDYPNVYRKLQCIYKSYRKCNGCFFNKEGICASFSSENLRVFDQEIGQFLRTATGEVEIYE